MRNVNLLALLVVAVAGALVWHGDVNPDAFLLLVTGLAIPARSDGYQAVGTGPANVRVVNDTEDAVPVEDAGHADPVGLALIVLFLLVVLLLLGVLPTIR